MSHSFRERTSHTVPALTVHTRSGANLSIVFHPNEIGIYEGPGHPATDVYWIGGEDLFALRELLDNEVNADAFVEPKPSVTHPKLEWMPGDVVAYLPDDGDRYYGYWARYVRGPDGTWLKITSAAGIANDGDYDDLVIEKMIDKRTHAILFRQADVGRHGV